MTLGSLDGSSKKNPNVRFVRGLNTSLNVFCYDPGTYICDVMGNATYSSCSRQCFSAALSYLTISKQNFFFWIFINSYRCKVSHIRSECVSWRSGIIRCSHISDFSIEPVDGKPDGGKLGLKSLTSSPQRVASKKSDILAEFFWFTLANKKGLTSRASEESPTFARHGFSGSFRVLSNHQSNIFCFMERPSQTASVACRHLCLDLWKP